MSTCPVLLIMKISEIIIQHSASVTKEVHTWNAEEKNSIDSFRQNDLIVFMPDISRHSS